MGRGLTSPNTTEIQSQATIAHYPMAIRLAQKKEKERRGRRYREVLMRTETAREQSLCPTLLEGMKLCITAVENNTAFLQTLKIESA